MMSNEPQGTPSPTLAPEPRAVRAYPAAAKNGPFCRKRPRCAQQPDVHLVFFVATTSIAAPECARLVDSARAIEAATRFNERTNVASDPDANRSDVFVLCPANVANEPRAAPT